ncbi:MAG: HAMP domain-containing protein [Pyrinomonadaceae bacterium]|nr:HAMP domain-containing protein [Pyrinomonadaceae bacterium]
MDDQINRGHTAEVGERNLRRRSALWLLGGLVLLLLSILVALQVFGLWEVYTPETAIDTLFLYALSSLNFVAFFVFAFIFVRNLLKLRRERRERQLGSKIKTRLVVYFITVSLLPITAMAVFSYIFFNRSLEKWFGRIPEEIVKEAQAARDEDAVHRAQSLVESARLSALTLDQQAAQGTKPEPGDLIERGGFDALTIVSPEGAEEMRFREDVDFIGTKELDGAMDTARSRLRSGALGGQSLSVSREAIVAVVPFGDGWTLFAARDQMSNSHLEKIVSGAETFEHLRKRQRKVRLLGLSTLGLLTLMLLFAATWSAIHLARGIATPIRALAEASDEVARGNLGHRVTAAADDELALLADSFNAMTAQLEENRRRIETGAAELQEKNLALAERRDYIETVLESLSTGVVSVDASDHVTTINGAALTMLGVEAAPRVKITLGDMVGAETRLVLERIIWRARLRGRAAEQLDLVRRVAHHGEEVDGGIPATIPVAVPVAITATALGHLADEGRGVVVMMEDLSELLAAQRAAAWSEVARRMAHEIKNPLTPIQLSAERIARNFQRSFNGEHIDNATLTNGASGNGHGNGAEGKERVARIVEECTATITREVAGLKAMVDEFTRFARLPHARLECADLNEVTRQAVALYEDRLDDVRMDVRLAHALPSAMLDAEQLRRVFVNLIDNAVESLAETEGERRITVATGHDHARGLLLAEVVDTGHGVAHADMPRLFQPYFTTRGRGTGLGLAIVQRIIAEHGGRIRAETNRPRGARFIFELPVAEEGKWGSEAGGRYRKQV